MGVVARTAQPVGTYTIASGCRNPRLTCMLNQRIGGALWQPLGTYTFSSNRGQGVTLSDQADGIVVADAIGAGPAPGNGSRCASCGCQTFI